MLICSFVIFAETENLNYFDLFKNSGLYFQTEKEFVLGKNNSLDLVNYWIPNFEFEILGNKNGNFDSEDNSYKFCPNLKISQNIPGGILLSMNLENNLAFQKYGFDFIHNFSVLPTVSFEIPLIFDKELFRNNVKNEISYVKSYSELLNQNYLNNKKENLKDFIDSVGNFLYYLELRKVLKSKKIILNKQEESYEKLVLNGKISSYDYSEKIKETYSLLKEISQNENNILEIQEKLILMDLKIYNENLCDIEKLKEFSEKVCLNEFLNFWISFVDNKFLKNENDLIYSEKVELLLLDKNNYEDVKNQVKISPYFYSSFSLNSSVIDFGKSVGFKNSIWDFSFGINVPISSGSSIFLQEKNYKLSKEIYNLKKEKIYNKMLLKFNKVSSIKNIYFDYIFQLFNQLKTDEKRLEVFNDLLKVGKISQLDYDLQENQKQMSELYFVKSKLDYVCSVLSSL